MKGCEAEIAGKPEASPVGSKLEMSYNGVPPGRPRTSEEIIEAVASPCDESCEFTATEVGYGCGTANLNAIFDRVSLK